MAKELPYFKFEPSEWLEGEIQICSDTAIVCFTNLCSGYWLKLGSMSYAFALHKYMRKDANLMQELINSNIIALQGDEISINFLDKQLQEFKKISSKRSESAKKRWKKNADNQEVNANALQELSKSNAIREEKIREEDNIIYSEETFLNRWKDARLHFDKKPTHIKKLTTFEKLNFNKLKSDYGKEEFDQAIQGLFSQDTFPATRLRPTHFLEREHFEKYLTCFHTKEKLFKQNNKKPIDRI